MNLKKIKEMLKSKNGMIATGVVLGALVIGIASSVMLNEESKESGTVENNKQVIVNKDKDNNKNKTDEEKDKTKEEVDKREDSNTLTEDKNEETVKQEDKKENEVASTKEEKSTSTNNSKVETNNSTSKPSNNTTNNTSSSNKPQSNEKPSVPNTHTHSWKEVYKDVAHSEEGHWEDVLVSPAWSEEVPVYEEKVLSICNGCGKDITSDPGSHMKEEALKGNYSCGSWHTEYKDVQIGSNTINHPAVYEKKWIIDKAAWTEKVLTGHQCSCGATK